MIDLEYDDVDEAFAESVARLCDARLAHAAGVTPAWSHEWWHAVAELGILALTTPDGGGTVTTIAAAMESLGKADAPGPFVETVLAVQLLGDADAAAVVSGEQVVTIKTGDAVAWLPIASYGRLLELLDKASRDAGLPPVGAVDPARAGAADISFVAGRVEMAIDGLGLKGRADHTVEETADLTMLPVQAKRAALYREAQKILVEDAPWVFVDHEIQIAATSKRVQGFKLHPSFDLRTETVTLR